ncbi:MAG: reverse transcriptase family protein [Opitutaceae bacterium]|nr:reverse transcriptase family protein [Opitutaceae bacterium]
MTNAPDSAPLTTPSGKKPPGLSVTLTVERHRLLHVILDPAAWRMFREALQTRGAWSRRGRILKATLVAEDFRGWSPRPYLPPDSPDWSETVMELHPPTEPAAFERLIATAMEHFRILEQEDAAAFDRSLRNTWEKVRRAAMAAHALAPSQLPRPFPVYAARLAAIPKKRPGEFRVIAVPDRAQLAAGRSLLPYLHSRLDPALPIHGFVPGRNPVTNAQPHRGFGWSLTMDLADFFDHVTADKLVDAGLPRSIARLITDRDGVARQGYATSPAASNLAFQTVDHRILALLAAECPGAVYTRYADDLTISANDREALIRVQRNLEALIASAGFKVSARKTHVLAARAGRRVVTGVAVGETDLRATRSARRRLRAAEHADNRMQARGLREWSLLKAPRDKLP